MKTDTSAFVNFSVCVMQKSFRNNRRIKEGQWSGIPVEFLQRSNAFWRNFYSHAGVVFGNGSMTILVIILVQVNTPESIKFFKCTDFFEFYLAQECIYYLMELFDVDESLFSKNKVTVVNFWFSGCKPCVEELSKLNELNDAGIKTTRGNEFTINSLRHILHNRAYIGEYHYNDIVIPDGMPSIIPCELFKTAQERFELNRRIKCHKSSTMAKNVSESRFWLTGKLYCGKCGESMHGLSGTSKTGATHYYYACNNHRKHKCTLKNIPQHQMELNVISILKTFLNDSENLASLAVDIANYHKSRNDNSAFIASLEEMLKQNEKQITNIVNAIANGAMSSALTDKLQQLEIEKGSLTDAIEVEQAKARLIVDEHSVKEYFKQYANANLDDAEIRDSVLNYFVDKIYVYDDKITVTGCFSGEPTEIPFTEFSEFDCETVSSILKSAM